MNSSRTVIAAVALAGTVGLSACSGGSSSAHTSSAAKKAPSSSSSPASTPSSSSTSSSPTTTPTVSALITKMQSNLRNAKSLHLQAKGHDIGGTLLGNGSQDISIDLVGAVSGDPNEAQITSGDAAMRLRTVNGLHYVKANSAFWKAAANKNGSGTSNPKIKSYADKWLKTPASMTTFDEMSMPTLLKPLLNSSLSGSDGLSNANTDITSTSLNGTPAWKLTNKDGEGDMWISQKTDDILEFKLGNAPTNDAPLNDFTFSDVNKDFHITAPTDAIVP